MIRMMIKWYNDVSAGCHKLPKDFKWQGQLSGLWWWWWWWCWVSRTKGIIIMLMMMVTMMVMLMMISCPQTSPTLSIQVWDWNSHSYHQYRLHHNPVSPFVQQSWTQHIMQGTMTQVTARCYPKIMIMIMILMMIATIIMTIITMTMMMEPQLSPTLLGIAHLRWGELNDFQLKANCEDPGMPILIVKIPRPRTPHPICWWIQWRSQFVQWLWRHENFTMTCRSIEALSPLLFSCDLFVYFIPGMSLLPVGPECHQWGLIISAANVFPCIWNDCVGTILG